MICMQFVELCSNLKSRHILSKGSIYKAIMNPRVHKQQDGELRHKFDVLVVNLCLHQPKVSILWSVLIYQLSLSTWPSRSEDHFSFVSTSMFCLRIFRTPVSLCPPLVWSSSELSRESSAAYLLQVRSSPTRSIHFRGWKVWTVYVQFQDLSF